MKIKSIALDFDGTLCTTEAAMKSSGIKGTKLSK